MIDRQNWLDIRIFVRYISDVRQNSPETVKRTRGHLRHLLEWANDRLLGRAEEISPTFPAYLVARHLSASSIKKGLEATRHFYTFALDRWPQRYRHIHASWIALLQPPRGARLESSLPDHRFYTLEEVCRLAAVATETLRQERARAAACFLFLSGMRADAFASLPLSCVDLERRQVLQLPERGVRTKNRKAGRTYLLEIPDLLEIVESWDRRVRSLPPESLWYSPVTRDGMTLAPATAAHIGRGDLVKRDMMILCELAGSPYLSPHKLRHGHVVYALKNARNLAELKAISQNVMHASVTITDQVYGRLVDDDVRTIITSLGKTIQPVVDDRLDEILRLLRRLA